MQTKILVSVVVLMFLTSVSGFAASGEKAKAKGMITTRTGETLVVKSDGKNVTVVLTDETTTRDKKGLFGLDREMLSNVVLSPGLKVDVNGTADDQGRIVAKTITVDGDDLETAEMIEAGLHPTAQQVATNMVAIESNRQDTAANKLELAAQKETIDTHQQNIEKNMRDIDQQVQRFAALSEFDLKGQTVVKFKVSSSEISDADQEQLKQLAQSATGLTGYIVEVMGYADSSGDAAMNTKLSEDRAKSVITYLIQQCGIPVRHIVAPGAMGEYGPAASNETTEGRADNRRVEVKILVNKGIAGS